MLVLLCKVICLRCLKKVCVLRGMSVFAVVFVSLGWFALIVLVFAFVVVWLCCCCCGFCVVCACVLRLFVWVGLL